MSSIVGDRDAVNVAAMQGTGSEKRHFPMRQLEMYWPGSLNPEDVSAGSGLCIVGTLVRILQRLFICDRLVQREAFG